MALLVPKWTIVSALAIAAGCSSGRSTSNGAGGTDTTVTGDASDSGAIADVVGVTKDEGLGVLGPYVSICSRLASCVGQGYIDLHHCSTMLHAVSLQGQTVFADDVADVSPYLVPFSVRACIEGAKSCGAVNACLVGANPKTCDVPLGGCDGDSMLFCLRTPNEPDGSSFWRLDCEGFGLGCMTVEGQAICADPCSGTGMTCTNGVVSLCQNGVGLAIDCKTQGLTCTPGPVTDLASACKGTGADCNAESPPRCDGANAVNCRNGKEHSVDCDAYGHSCAVRQDFGAPEARCIFPDATRSTCTGGVLTIETELKTFTTTCAELGLSKCEKDLWCTF